MTEANSFQQAMDRIAEAQRAEREAKLSLLFQLAQELGYSVLPLGEPPIQEAEPASHTPPASMPWNTPDEVVSKPAYDGTFEGLIEVYKTHEESPYHKLKHAVRKNYANGLKRLTADVGSQRIADWNASVIQNFYDTKWAVEGKISMGQSMIAKLRLLASFGSVVLNDEDSTRLSTILSNMRFPVAPQRTEVLSYENARAVRAVAHSQFNWPSIAIAQAFQFEIPKLRQLDIIGEWIPMSEPGSPDITNGIEKWVGGLLWSDIDEKMILRKEIVVGRKGEVRLIHTDLRRFAMIMEEINNVPPWKQSGPMVVCEFSGIPWSAAEFRRKWRLVADKAGVPSNVKITDGVRGNGEAVESGKEDVSE